MTSNSTNVCLNPQSYNYNCLANVLRSECLPHTVLEGGMKGTRMHGRQECYVDRLNEEQQCGI